MRILTGMLSLRIKFNLVIKFIYFELWFTSYLFKCSLFKMKKKEIKIVLNK